MKKYRIRERSLVWYLQKYRIAIIALILTVGVAVAFVYANNSNSPSQSDEKPKVDQSIDEDEKQLEKDLMEFVPYDSIPLDAELQAFIFGVAEDYGVEGELILAMIGIESSYKPSEIGDDGESYGLMQVQPRWHEEEMERLKITRDELLDPYANVVLGVDIIAGYIEDFGITYGLIAYNEGPDDAIEKQKQGVISEYAESVLYYRDTL